MTLTLKEKLDMIEALPGARLAYDGCHKAYVCLNKGEADEMVDMGYDLHSVTEVRTLLRNSCGLEFVSHMNFGTYPWTIQQFEDEDGEYL